jgi:hypothetical protein
MMRTVESAHATVKTMFLLNMGGIVSAGRRVEALGI